MAGYPVFPRTIATTTTLRSGLKGKPTSEAAGHLILTGHLTRSLQGNLTKQVASEPAAASTNVELAGTSARQADFGLGGTPYPG